MSERLYLRLARDDSDTVLTAQKLLVSDERSDVDRHFDAAIFPGSFHGTTLLSFQIRSEARKRENTETTAASEIKSLSEAKTKRSMSEKEKRSHCLKEKKR